MRKYFPARFQPYNIRGWFWAATLATMGETNVFNGRKFNGWSSSGPGGRAQPDGILKQDGFGQQACMALLDNFFNDGLAWHDTKYDIVFRFSLESSINLFSGVTTEDTSSARISPLVTSTL